MPDRVSSAGREAVELAASAGLRLDPWQALVLEEALGERRDGKWSAFEVGLIVPRQNGKGSILEALELASLFLFGDQLILHSAHEFKTASEAFRRVWGLVQSTPDLERRVMRVRTSHGDEGIELRGGQRLRFVARSTGSGRGFSGDKVILDEAYNLSPEAMAALLPTMAARPNPQIWYTSSAPLVSSSVLRKLCKRGRAGESPSLAYLEWCAAQDVDSDDPSAWAAANPSLGYRTTSEFIENERAALEDGAFRRERLGIWFDDDDEFVVDPKRWAALADKSSPLQDPVAFAVDVSPDRSSTSIGVAAYRQDGERHVELADVLRGTAGAARRVVDMAVAWKPRAIVVDPASPAGSLVADINDGLRAAGVALEVTEVSAREVGQACGVFFDGTMGDGIPVHHLDQPDLNAALAGAKQRTLGDAWAWGRRQSKVNVSPLVAVTLALWAARPAAVTVPARFVSLDAFLDEEA